jgi:PPOX class probable F420-dependent enzyme
MAITIPASHLDLLTGPIHAVLSTVMPDGSPQASLVWVDYDGDYLLVNTTLERRKSRNMQTNPKVALLLIDPHDTSRWLEVRGIAVAFESENVETHADRLTQQYTGKHRFYGDIYPVDQREKERRVIVKIEPLKITLDAAFR